MRIEAYQVSPGMRFYSAGKQQGLEFTPNSTLSAPYHLGVIETYGDGLLPDSSLDLPQAVAILQTHGMRAKQIHEAQIQDWGHESSAGNAGVRGVEWIIVSQLDERFVVQALNN